VLRCVVGLGRTEALVRLDDRAITIGRDLLKQRLPPVLTHQYDQLKAAQGREKPSAALNVLGPNTILRLEILQGRVMELGPAAALCTKKLVLLTEEERVKLARQIDLVRILEEREGLKGTEQKVGPSVVGRVEAGPQVIRATAEVRDFTACCGEPCIPDKPLHLLKWADRQSAQIGDVVTFTLKYTNLGGRAITDVAVSDSLSPRLEYVPGSAQADRDAVFTVQPNEAGSVVLRWEIGGRLAGGQSGVVRFQAKVR
jgi:uncharacterized repeat protein (TIGR01451 family)